MSAQGQVYLGRVQQPHQCGVGPSQQPDVNVGITGLEGLDYSGQVVQSQVSVSPNCERALVLWGVHIGFQGVYALNDGSDYLENNRALGSQLDGTLDPVEEEHPKLLLQFPQLMADCRLAYP